MEVESYKRLARDEEDVLMPPSFLEHYTPPLFKPTNDDMDLFVVDIECQKRKLPSEEFDDSGVSRTQESAPGNKRGREWGHMVPCIRIYSKTRYGSSVCLNVYGYYPVVRLLTSCPLDSHIVTEIRNVVWLHLISLL